MNLRKVRSFAFSVGITFSGLASAETFIGTVVGVTDGDTIKLHAGEQLKIRLSGIDAPERKQPFGQASKQHLSDLAFQRHAKADCYLLR